MIRTTSPRHASHCRRCGTATRHLVRGLCAAGCADALAITLRRRPARRERQRWLAVEEVAA